MESIETEPELTRNHVGRARPATAPDRPDHRALHAPGRQITECGAEDFRYGLAINRIRHYYKEIAGRRADLFLLSGHDDGVGVFANMSVPVRGRKPYFAFSTAILVINSVVGGAAVGCALGILFEAPLWVATSVGGVAAIVSVFTWIRYAARLLDATAAVDEPLFPSAGAVAVSTQHTEARRRGS